MIAPNAQAQAQVAAKPRVWLVGRSFSMKALLVVVLAACIGAWFLGLRRQQSVAVLKMKSQAFQVFYAGADFPREVLWSPNRHKSRLYRIQEEYTMEGQRIPLLEPLEFIIGPFGHRRFDTVMLREHYTFLRRDPADEVFALDPEPPQGSSYQDHQVTTAEIENINRVIGLRTLSITTDYGFNDSAQAIAHCSSLKVVHIDAPRLTGAELEVALSGKKLERLVLASLPKIDESLCSAIAAAKTENLTFVCCGFPQHSREAVLQAFPNALMIDCYSVE